MGNKLLVVRAQPRLVSPHTDFGRDSQIGSISRFVRFHLPPTTGPPNFPLTSRLPFRQRKAFHTCPPPQWPPSNRPLWRSSPSPGPSARAEHQQPPEPAQRHHPQPCASRANAPTPPPRHPPTPPQPLLAQAHQQPPPTPAWTASSPASRRTSSATPRACAARPSRTSPRSSCCTS